MNNNLLEELLKRQGQQDIQVPLRPQMDPASVVAPVMSTASAAAAPAASSGLLAAAGGPLGAGLAAGGLIANVIGGIMQAKAAKKRERKEIEQNAIQSGTQQLVQNTQQGMASRNAALESLMRKL